MLYEVITSRVDDVILGDANQAGEDNRNVARMAALLAGLPVEISGTTMNRLCASGMDAVGTAARGIKAGDYDLVITSYSIHYTKLYEFSPCWSTTSRESLRRSQGCSRRAATISTA